MNKADIDLVASAVKAIYSDTPPSESERTEGGGEVDPPVLVRVVRGARRQAVQRLAVELADRIDRRILNFNVPEFFDACGMGAESKLLSAELLRGRFTRKVGRVRCT